jgi:hypothetical protein
MTDFRPKQIRIIWILFLCLGFSVLHAQEAIPAGGGNASGSGGSVSYSVGQAAYSTNTGANGSVAQGAQQPYEIFIVTGLEDAIGIEPYLSVYPNPTTDILTLKVDLSTKLNIQSMSYQLFDLNGKLIENKNLTGNETSIDMKNRVPASYFLKVIDKNKEVIIFKIIKK